MMARMATSSPIFASGRRSASASADRSGRCRVTGTGMAVMEIFAAPCFQESGLWPDLQCTRHGGMKAAVKIDRSRSADRQAAFRFRRQIDVEAFVTRRCRMPEYIIISPDDHIADMQFGRRRTEFHARDGDLIFRRRCCPGPKYKQQRQRFHRQLHRKPTSSSRQDALHASDAA
ncbi:hypothetical protein RHECNPAF_1700045 [Rhizobium etli CNPAF512]|nr:hypothetical protein RHECNPAF_1700045 [Rhizobium etli CNPAF512]